MTLRWKKGSPSAEATDVLVVPAFSEGEGTTWKAIDRRLGGMLGRLAKGGDFKGERDELHVVGAVDGGVKAKRVALLGLGDRAAFAPEALRRGAAVVAASLGERATSASFCIDDLPLKKGNAEAAAQAVGEGFGLSLYRFGRFNGGKAPKLKRIVLIGARDTHAKAVRAGLKAADAISSGVATARDLGNLPGNHGTPPVLANEARKMARATGLKARVMGPAEMKKRKMGSLLSVSLGSPIEPRLIVLEHGQKKKGRPTIVLVGKGLTFDSGGISIKPSADMDKMRYDKCGGCVVIGAMEAVARLGLDMHVVGIVPSSENMPGGNANKPGDIVTASNGKTIQILNTDAEGRLILADALVHAQTFKPDAIVDLATLTGACMVALGQHCAGLMSRHDELAERLAAAGEAAHERAWRLPLWDEYIDEMKGDVSDLKNLGGRYGGAITAGGFLRSFVGDHAWAHLDIAGVSWDDAARPYNKGKGATGFGVRLLVEFLRSYDD